ncbi:unnamed protein product [Effrenium voratum]|nr:unnamed protein product [Effrenium voratum]
MERPYSQAAGPSRTTARAPSKAMYTKKSSLVLEHLAERCQKSWKPRPRWGRGRQAAFAVAAWAVSVQIAVLAERAFALKEVFCLNLDGYPKRWSFMQRQLEALHMSATRWPVDGLAGLDVNDLSQLGLVKQHALKRYCLPAESKLHGIDLTAEGIGRALSHMQVWKHVAMNYEDDDMCLVLEDDCLFLPEFSLASLRERLAKVPANWQIVFLGGQDLLQKQRRLAAEGVHRLYRGFQGTTAYVVTASGCKACLEVTVPLSWQVDTHLAENEVQAGQITYTVKPPEPKPSVQPNESRAMVGP